jgi:hemoglobin/transferrin/lactoferrin receptor protein
MLRLSHACIPDFASHDLSRHFFTRRLGSLATILTAACYAGPIMAQVAQTSLKEITVSATRGERRIDEVPASVTVITSEEIEREGARDLKDIFRNELDVTVPSGPTRFSNAGTASGRAGNEGVNIRGLGGNQVLMLIDGIRVPNGFSFGSFHTGRGDYLDIDGIKSVEVLRGPASTQYGSDGLAGAVSFQTLNPADLYKKDTVGGGFLRTGYASVDRSWSSTLGLGGKSGVWQGMILGSYRLGHQTINQGHNEVKNLDRTSPNPVDYNNRYLLAKAILTINPQQQLGLTLESQRRTQATEVYSARAVPPYRPFSTTHFSTKDRINRDRISLDHRYTDLSASLIQKSETRLYWQDAQINQFATEARYRARDRTRDNTYQTNVIGGATQFESNLTGVLDQRLTYGLDWSQANIKGVRDGTVPPYGSVFPEKPFPDTVYTLSGAFLQSEIELGDLTITPGVRFDYYRISPSTVHHDTGTSRSGYQATTTQGKAFTPRLGVVWSLHPLFAPYAQYAQGFRAPSPDQVNNGFRNLASGYSSIGNPNLKPEFAESFEIGLRGDHQTFNYSLSAFTNRYKNFISQEIVGGLGRPSNPTIYQYVNLTDAHIQGVVAKANWRFDTYWGLETGFAYLNGDSTIRGKKQPLSSIQPLNVLLGLRYDSASWGARVNWLWNAGKSLSRIPESLPAQFATPAYGTLDLGMYWKPQENITLNANINNLFNAHYWRWSDVSGLANNSNIKDAYTAPGRNIQLSIRVDF